MWGNCASRHWNNCRQRKLCPQCRRSLSDFALILCAAATNGSKGAGFSDATRATFGWRGALPGVGEALKREIAGLGLVGRLLLWGLSWCGCFDPYLPDPLNGVH